MKNRSFAIFLVLVTAAVVGCSLPKITLFSEQSQPLEEHTLQGTTKEKILVMSIDGVISGQRRGTLLRTQPSMIQGVAAYLRRAETDKDIKTLLIKVSSPGGTVTASDIIYHEISAYIERTGVKVVVAMMGTATSGGYYVSLPADVIVAHPTTITGSIGVIYLRPNFSGLMEKMGLSVGVNTSGPNKDTGSPYRPATEEENALFQELTDAMARRFMGLVVRHRNLNEAQQRQIATARVFLAEDALDLGLVDSIGYLDDAVARAAEMAGLGRDARVVAYRRYEPRDDTIYNPSLHSTKEVPSALSPVMTQLAAVSEAGFYYIWPAGIGR